jgi:hypothetical protein
MRLHGNAVVPDLIGRLWTERSRPLICLLRNGQARVWCGNLGNTLRSLSLDTVPISAIRCWGWMLLRRSAKLERSLEAIAPKVGFDGCALCVAQQSEFTKSPERQLFFSCCDWITRATIVGLNAPSSLALSTKSVIFQMQTILETFRGKYKAFTLSSA